MNLNFGNLFLVRCYPLLESRQQRQESCEVVAYLCFSHAASHSELFLKALQFQICIYGWTFSLWCYLLHTIPLLHQNHHHQWVRIRLMQNDDIQLEHSDNRQEPSNIHHIQNLNYEVVYVNSFNTHSFKVQDSGNNHSHSHRWSFSSCRSSIVSDEARQLYQISSHTRKLNRNISNNPLTNNPLTDLPRQTLLSRWFHHRSPCTTFCCLHWPQLSFVSSASS